MFRLVKHSFSNLRSKLLTSDVIKNDCDVITLILAIFVWNQKPNSHLLFEPSIRHFFQKLWQ